MWKVEMITYMYSRTARLTAYYFHLSLEKYFMIYIQLSLFNNFYLFHS